jgi:hypothetical protein
MFEYPALENIGFSVTVPALPRYEPDSYVLEITGTLHVATNETEIQTGGTIKVLKILATEAENEHVRLYDVCDAHSDFLAALYSAVFDQGRESKAELQIEPFWRDILVLWEINIKPAFRNTGIVAHAFETAIAAFGSQDIIAAALDDDNGEFIGLPLTIDEWKNLGFAKIAGTRFTFRDNCHENPYRKAME